MLSEDELADARDLTHSKHHFRRAETYDTCDVCGHDFRDTSMHYKDTDYPRTTSERAHLALLKLPALLSHIDALKAEIDDLEQAKTAEDVWPKWALSVHKLLTERGVYLGDEDECHLPDDLAEYIREFEKACEEIQHPLLAVTKDGTLDLSATIATARTSALKEAAGVASKQAKLLFLQSRIDGKFKMDLEKAAVELSNTAAAILALAELK